MSGGKSQFDFNYTQEAMRNAITQLGRKLESGNTLYTAVTTRPSETHSLSFDIFDDIQKLSGVPYEERLRVRRVMSFLLEKEDPEQNKLLDAVSDPSHLDALLDESLLRLACLNRENKHLESEVSAKRSKLQQGGQVLNTVEVIKQKPSKTKEETEYLDASEKLNENNGGIEKLNKVINGLKKRKELLDDEGFGLSLFGD